MTTIHLVFKTHLDIGFTRAAQAVVDAYLDDYLPRAIALARDLRTAGGAERFTWTTGSWLVHEALERGDGPRRRLIETGIADGDLRWHALPFTTHSEYLDAGLVRHGLSLSRALDRRFGLTTTAAKMTDVPGHTVALVPLLAEAGINLLHLGVNPASAVPAVPAAFRWRCDGAEVAVLYESGYGGLCRVPGCDHWLAFGHTGDNHGPQDAAGVRAQFAALRARHPASAVRASTLEAFATTDAVVAALAALPVVEDEIGDSWIHGVGSDPWKTRRFRALARWRADLLAARPELAAHRALRRFSDRLLLVGEHTWGHDTKRWDGPEDAPARATVAETAWSNAALAAARAIGAYDDWEDSWAEQRAYLDQAVAALDGTAWAEPARAVLREAPADDDGWQEVDPAAARTERLALDPAAGALVRLRLGGHELADAAHHLAGVRYQVYGRADYDAFIAAYNPDLAGTRAWALADFHKPGLPLAQGREWTATAVRAWRRADANALRWELALPAEATELYGAPRRILVEATVAADSVCQMTLRWTGKTATRVPEALWWSFLPAVTDAGAWRLRKLGRLVDPRRTVARGGRALHAVETAENAGLVLATPDAPLLACGAPRLLHGDPPPADAAAGLHLNLVNNVWGTNFPQWYEEDAAFRVSLGVTPRGSAG